MRTRCFLSAVAVALLLAPAPADADNLTALKRSIISKCSDAEKEFETLPEESRQALVPYLSRVLRLQPTTQAASQPAPLADPNLPFEGQALEAFTYSNASRSFDPLHEVEAKRCAVRLLGRMPTLSVEALVELFPLGVDPTVPRDLRDDALRVAEGILTFASQDATIKPTEDFVARTLRLTGGPGAFYSESVLVEFGPRAVPGLLTFIRSSDDSVWKAARRNLENIERTWGGSQVVGEVLPYLGMADEVTRERAVRLLSALSDPASRVTAALITKLDDVSPIVREATFQGLNSIFAQRLPIIEADAATIVTTQLLASLKQSRSRERENISAWIMSLASHLPGLEGELAALYRESDGALRSEILEIIASLTQPSRPTLDLVIEALDDPDPLIRHHAVEALPAFRSFSPVLQQNLARVVKRLHAQKATPERESMLLSIAGAVAELQLGAQAAPMIPAFVEALRFQAAPAISSDPGNAGAPAPDPDLPAAVRALVSIGKPARGALEKAAQTSTGAVKHSVLGGLLALKPLSPQAETLVIRALNDDSSLVRDTAITGLSTLLTEPLSAKISKAQRNYSADGKNAAAEVLLHSAKPDTSSIERVIASAETSTCPVRYRKLGLLHRVTTDAGPPVPVAAFSEQQKESITQNLIRCLGQGSASDESALALLGLFQPLPPAAEKSLTDLLQGTALPSQLAIDLLFDMTSLGVSNEKVVEFIRKRLNDSEGAHKLSILKSVRGHPEIARLLEKDLLQLSESSNAEPSVRLAAAIDVALFSPALIKLVDIYLGEFRSDRRQLARRSLIGVPADVVAPLLGELLSRVPEEDRDTVIFSCGDLEERGTSVIPMLLPYLNHKDEKLRSAALVSLLSIDPTHAEVFSALRAALRSPVALDLLKPRYPERLRAPLAQILQAPTSRTEVLFAMKLQERIQ